MLAYQFNSFRRRSDLSVDNRKEGRTVATLEIFHAEGLWKEREK